MIRTMEENGDMRLKDHYETISMEDKLVAVFVGDDATFNGALKLNKTAAVIFELLKNEVSEEQIVNSLSQRFDVPRDRLVGDVYNCISEFRKRDLLIE